MSSDLSIKKFDYPRLLAQVKQRVRMAQQRAAYSAYGEMLPDSNTQSTIAQLDKQNTQLSVAQLDEILCREGDNQTIGLLLCRTKDKIKAEYALRGINKPIGVSDYELGQTLPHDLRSSLPKIEDIENDLIEYDNNKQ